MPFRARRIWPILGVLASLLILGGAAGVIVATGLRPARVPVLTPRTVSVDVDGFLAWALLDRRTGTISGSANYATATSTTASMIKIWIAADHLRLAEADGHPPSRQRLDELTTMIRDSDNEAADDVYQLDGGNDVVNRMISTCGLTDTTVVDGRWGQTQITARDAVRLGLCVADGRAAGHAWTPWILTQMRKVRGEGRFGIIDALPSRVADTTAIKNGWTVVDADGEWHVACLGVQDRWILAVLTRYDASRSLGYGAGVCADVTRQLLGES
ncbi:serine hydrolase [Planosporangium mesophilum]|nr:serine hydrolase [Planosporangium mesophilum]NJC84374.1 serine hydrolase [Planosporangium mesophilum]